MAKTIVEEQDDHVRAFVRTFWSADTSELRTARKMLERVGSPGEQAHLIEAIARFTVSSVYYDQVLQGPVPGKPAGEVVITQHGRQLLEAMQQPQYVTVGDVALVFMQLKATFKGHLAPEQWAAFEQCLNIFEHLFNDPMVQYALTRNRRRTETPSARFLGLMRRLDEQGFNDVPQLAARLRGMPLTLFERVVLFLEDWEDQCLPLEPDYEGLQIPQLATRAWWRQLLEFADQQQINYREQMQQLL